MKKVLVTGIDGFTGQYVADLLEKNNYDVVGLVYSNPTENQVACDLTDKSAVKNMLDFVKPDYIIHLAAISFVGHQDLSAFYSVNVIGTLNLLEVARELKLDLKKVILASSANIYGNPPNVAKITEEQLPMPVNHYAMSKLAMEYMARLWFDTFPIVIVRPFNYTGPNQSPNFLIPKIVSHFKDKKAVIELGNTDVSRDFSDVRDIAACYVHLLNADIRSEVINLCSGNVYSLASIIEEMEKIAGYKIEVKVNPDFVRENEIKVLGGDNTKLEKLTGFKPSISLKQTLYDMYVG